MMNRTVVMIIGAAAAGLGTTASATFVTPASWSRGVGGTTYQHWDFFDQHPTDNTPDVGNINPNGQAAVTDVGGAFLLGSGNLYTSGGPGSFSVTVPEADVPAPPHNVTAIVQIKTQGTEVNPATVMVNGLAPVDTAELSRITLPGQGFAVETWYLFNIPYASFGDFDGLSDDLILTFSAFGPHMSLDQIAIDTAIQPFGYYPEPNPIPEPGSLAILGGLGVWGLARRRRG